MARRVVEKLKEHADRGRRNEEMEDPAEGAPQLTGQSKGNGEAAAPAYASEFLATSDGIALTKAFMRIKDISLRRRIVELVEEMAGDDSN